MEAARAMNLYAKDGGHLTLSVKGCAVASKVAQW